MHVQVKWSLDSLNSVETLNSCGVVGFAVDGGARVSEREKRAREKERERESVCECECVSVCEREGHNRLRALT